MEKSQIRTIASFFFYTLWDKNLVYEATTQAMRVCQSELKKTERKTVSNSFLIHTMYQVWKKLKTQKPRVSWEVQAIENPFLLPENFNIGPWRQFIKDEHPNISLMVIWSRLLGFTEKEIAEGMQVSQGTVRYRTGKGLKDLSNELKPGVGNA